MNTLNKNTKINYSLYLVTDRKILGSRDLCESIEEAIQGGVSIIQLREKNITTSEYFTLAEKVKKVTDKYNVPLIINDRLDIALAIDADGLHVGPDDLSVKAAREILGPDKIIGASTCNIKEARQAEIEGASYLGVGAIFPTSTKQNTDDVSLEDLSNIKKSVNIPIVAIGGINENNASSVMKSEVNGIAVVSAIFGKENIIEAAKNLTNIIKHNSITNI